MNAFMEEKYISQWVIDQLKLEPFSLVSYDYNNNIVEYNAFSHCNNIRGISGQTFECQPIISSKRSFDGNTEAFVSI